jgi:hypothetical protein
MAGLIEGGVKNERSIEYVTVAFECLSRNPHRIALGLVGSLAGPDLASSTSSFSPISMQSKC